MRYQHVVAYFAPDTPLRGPPAPGYTLTHRSRVCRRLRGLEGKDLDAALKELLAAEKAAVKAEKMPAAPPVSAAVEPARAEPKAPEATAPEPKAPAAPSAKSSSGVDGLVGAPLVNPSPSSTGSSALCSDRESNSRVSSTRLDLGIRHRRWLLLCGRKLQGGRGDEGRRAPELLRSFDSGHTLKCLVVLPGLSSSSRLSIVCSVCCAVADKAAAAEAKLSAELEAAKARHASPLRM